MTAFSVQIHDRLSSTSDEIQRLAAGGAPHGTVVIAREQTRGRGRQARGWDSPRGNLHLSLLLRPAIPARRVAEIGFLAAVAVADAVDMHLPETVRAGLKWPNDVRVRGAKVAGILLESELRGDAVGWVAVGIGVNVAHHPAGLPYAATSLHAEGASAATPEGLAARVLQAFERRTEMWTRHGLPAVLEAWRARADRVGETVQVRHGATLVSGRFEGIGDDGALLLGTDGGLCRITAGEVSFGPG